MGFSVAIDGPAGAGKSTIAKLLARELNFIYVDTGAMYRAIALHLLRKGVKIEDRDRFAAECRDADVTIRYEDGVQQVILNGENVSGLIRTEEVGNMASASSVDGEVRAKLLDLQRNLAKENDVVMDGRDIGTNILPNADAKFYLTASVEERANRRFKELTEKGVACDPETIKADIRERDERDMNREIAPLKQAEDAVLVDSSDMGIEEVLECMLQTIHKVRK